MFENLYALQFIGKVKKNPRFSLGKKILLSYSENNDVIYNERDQFFEVWPIYMSHLCRCSKNKLLEIL